MRLSKIRIAGFKSFVDPVTIDLRSNLTGILGPNGCGKSNTIDAVRWVMGESSAKYLRGASMDDVIFNGSSSRKPVGLASVELIFDNSDASLGGEYAKYAEIAIKRQVSRDGSSKYFLNGTKCRRRDITDIFLGTGLGPRSYAIIEQGMISRIIEAKPEELRNTLEEAAGISRYKERRRETANRMEHTRENLARLNDLREEVDKQLSRLERQAKAAQRFRELRQQQQQLEASILLLQWQALKTDSERRVTELGEHSQQYQTQLAEVETLTQSVAELRQQQTEANEQLNQIQAEYYQNSSDIARLEQSIQHQQEIQQRQQDNLRQVEISIEDSQRLLQQDQHKLSGFHTQVNELEPHIAAQTKQLAIQDASVNEAESQLAQWQEQWHQAQQHVAKPTQQAQVEKARMEQLERQLNQLSQRQARLQQEASQLDEDRFQEDIAELELKCEAASSAHLLAEEQLETLSQTLSQQQQQQQTVQAELDLQRSRRQSLQGRLTSLETLQQAGLEKTDQARQQWLQQHGLDQQPQLAESLQVEAGWETAVETLLNNDLDAICVRELQCPAELPESGITLLDTHNTPTTPWAEHSLAHKIHQPAAAHTLFSHVYCIATLEQALAQRSQLAAHESFITPEGVQIGLNWLRSRRHNDVQHGILQRQQEIHTLQQQLTELEDSLQHLQQQHNQLSQQISSQEQQRKQLQAESNRLHREESTQHSQLHSLQQRAEQLGQRRLQIEQELSELSQEYALQQEALLVATEARNAALEQLEHAQQHHDQLGSQRDVLQQAVNNARQAQQTYQAELQSSQLALETARTQQQNTQNQVERLQERLELLEQQRDELLEQLQLQDNPIQQLQHELSITQSQRDTIEQGLGQARLHTQEQETSIRQQDQARLQAEQKAEQLRSAQEQRKLDWQAVQVREQTLAEQLEKLECDLPELPEEADITAYQEQLASVQNSIQRLGAINLAAIEEFQQESERKQYLDQQCDDLLSALETLETAIRKIDRETRARFKDTFERINYRLNEMFPRLFGGGECHLEMTENDLLTTGISIMARPPGKRISSIHLMSGGEKALTAVALVFAIFELNPAPFCMLDEVDAPLDEANVGRFCELVRHMSEQVQFIFITHNKTTMELAENLIGVTMREPGVSRLVSVNIDEAVKLANG